MKFGKWFVFVLLLSVWGQLAANEDVGRTKAGSSPNLDLDIPSWVDEKASGQFEPGRIPVYAVAMEVHVGGEILQKQFGVLAGETANLRFLDGDARKGYEIRVITPEETHDFDGRTYGNIKLMVVRNGERREILAEPSLMLPMDGETVFVALQGDEGSGVSIEMTAKQLFVEK